MLHTLRRAALLWPTVFTIIGLVLLANLGLWQLHRRVWKEDLIARIRERVTAPPISLARLQERAQSDADIQYMHVVARGHFLHHKERYLYAPGRTGLAWHVYTPLEIAPGRVVWINRGAVPDARKLPDSRSEGQIPGEVEVRGLLRPAAKPAFFAPANDASHNIWYWPDLMGMSASAFPAGSPVETLPFAIEADASPTPPGGLPQGGVTRLTLPNRHLEYAVTWFGLALTLIGVYFAFAVNRLKSARDGE